MLNQNRNQQDDKAYRQGQIRACRKGNLSIFQQSLLQMMDPTKQIGYDTGNKQ